jgi:membrane protein
LKFYDMYRRVRPQAPCPEACPPEGARNWKATLWCIYENFSTHRIMAVAAGVTFYALLALFPGIAALISLYGLFADPGTISQHVNGLSSIVPGGGTQIITDQMNRVAAQGNGRLSAAFLIALAISLWSANSGMKAICDALNVVYGVREQRSFIMLNAISLALTLALTVFLLLAMAGLVVVPAILSFVGEPDGAPWLGSLLRWPVLLAAIMLIVTALYRYAPSRDNARWRWITRGSVFSAVAWLAVSVLFSWYTAHFGSYNKTYGSLGAVFGFMTWIWLSITVVLLGAEIDAELERCAP